VDIDRQLRPGAACDIDNNDDDICLKAGRDYDGMRVNRPTEYVVIRNASRDGAAISFAARPPVASQSCCIGTRAGHQ
jgi:hypothetical protein